MSVEFISNYSAIQTSIRNTFGFIRITPNNQTSASSILPHQNPINNDFVNEPNFMGDVKSNKHKISGKSNESNLHENWFSPPLDLSMNKKLKTNEGIESNYPLVGSTDMQTAHQESKFSPTSNIQQQQEMRSANKYDAQNKQFSHSTSNLALRPCTNSRVYSSASNLMKSQHQAEYGAGMKNSVQLTRSKMIYHCKFGEFGVLEGQVRENFWNSSFCRKKPIFD